ncbi:phenylalanine ammonia-lyase [Clathrospora elynae]|uniref:Phenylalanine ammonia-lyase n=1 Tax=Clathrospora elynae TaxID=706981 RepID=A0A6A5SNX9_9PLEO|nr:phenylalanine ammonia-lyase [Clathrospora elynae]
MQSTTPEPTSPPRLLSQRACSHTSIVIAHWKALNHGAMSLVDGHTLTLATVAAVAKHKATARLADTDEVRRRIDKSVDTLNEHLKNGLTVYGVNTGFGGSADVRCKSHEMHALQRALLQLQHVGILPTPSSKGNLEHSTIRAGPPPLTEEWVRATMLIRANSLARGHSAVRSSTIKAILALLHQDIVPLIPSRGSISASGDLSPLSYIAGVLEGNESIYCWTGPPHCRRLVSASVALSSIKAEPVTFGPKEALGLTNGTAVSCAVGSLTLHSMHNILALSQLLTAMNVEAVLGTAGSFAPFISKVRPHTGQKQVASTILAALQGSRLATPIHGMHGHALFQDRYSLRTVPQWLGPFLEDMLLAHDQLTVEMNSTTDNPLIDSVTGEIHHGGNFQAISVTSAMEKCRLAAQAIGRMLFSQFTELVNHATNRGLPPNLSADDPSTSFTMKGVDIAMAAYMSELSFLANPVHNHVVSAEMGNQALNSLALISARYTDTAVEVLQMMCASTLYGVCQALDLRAMQRIFHTELKAQLEQGLDDTFGNRLDEEFLVKAKETVWHYVKQELDKTTAMGAAERFGRIMAGAKVPLLDVLAESVTEHPMLSRGPILRILGLQDWCLINTTQATALYRVTRDRYFLEGDATELLGRASKLLYRFVRRDLKVPMNRGMVDHPMPNISFTPETAVTNGTSINGASTNGAEQVPKTNGHVDDEAWRKKTIGHYISVIYESIKSEKIMDAVVECLEHALEECEGGL